VKSHRRDATRRRNVCSSTARDHRLFGLGAVLAQPFYIVIDLFLEALPAFSTKAVRYPLAGLYPDQPFIFVVPVADDVHDALL